MSNESYDHSYPPAAGYAAPGQPPTQGAGTSAVGYGAQGLPHAGRGSVYHTSPHPWGYPYGAGYPTSAQMQSQTPFLNLGNERFLKGLLIGAAAAYLLTNESVQRSAIKGVVKVWSMLQGGVEEIKERFHDAEAEIRAAEAAQGE